MLYKRLNVNNPFDDDSLTLDGFISKGVVIIVIELQNIIILMISLW